MQCSTDEQASVALGWIVLRAHHCDTILLCPSNYAFKSGGKCWCSRHFFVVSNTIAKQISPFRSPAEFFAEKDVRNAV